MKEAKDEDLSPILFSSQLRSQQASMKEEKTDNS